MFTETETLLRLVLARLERVSVDSTLAHRASGVRGALLKYLDESEQERRSDERSLDPLLEQAFSILEQEAQRIAR